MQLPAPMSIWSCEHVSPRIGILFWFFWQRDGNGVHLPVQWIFMHYTVILYTHYTTEISKGLLWSLGIKKRQCGNILKASQQHCRCPSVPLLSNLTSSWLTAAPRAPGELGGIKKLKGLSQTRANPVGTRHIIFSTWPLPWSCDLKWFRRHL